MKGTMDMRSGWPEWGKERDWLRQVGLRVTKQRIQVVRALGSMSHPTPEDVYQELATIRPRISLATVYNTLDVLASKNLLQRVEAGGVRYFDTRVDRHVHLHCEGCRRMADIPLSDEFGSGNVPRTEMGWLIQWMEMVWIGYCPECQEHDRLGGGLAPL